MLDSYIPIAFILGLAGAFAGLSIVAARILSPKDPSPQKYMPYECGVTEVSPIVERFPVRFYLTAMLFVIFDVEVILLFPWAVNFGSSPAFKTFSLGAVGLFIGILLVAFAYEWRNGGLEWD